VCALFTVFSSTDFSLWGFAPATWADQAKINRKAHGLKLTLPASGKGRIEDRKTRTLEQHKSAPPLSSKSLNGWGTRHPPGPRDSKKYITCGDCRRVYFQPACRNSQSSRQKFGGKL
jgi:hypothetical protein